MFVDGDTLVFLTRLGLTPETDKQTVRRAYARELKQIDPETDAASFQALREAYDAALAWLDRRPVPSNARRTSPDFGLPLTPILLKSTQAATLSTEKTLPREVTEDPLSLARAVYDEFTVACPELMSGPQSKEKETWMAALERCRSDPRLFNFAASSMFESMMAKRLAAGWVPGNETLLVAANEVFDWSSNRRKLTQLGQLGALINRALDEHIMFEAQIEVEARRQRFIITRLRESDIPDAEHLLRDMPELERMQSCFPVWLPMMVPQASIVRWHNAHQTMLASRIGQTTENQAFERPSRSTGGTLGFFGGRILAALIIMGLLRFCSSGFSHHQQTSSNGPTPNVYVSDSPDVAPTAERLDEIRTRIDYKFAPPVRKGTTLEATFDVFLDADGSVLGMNKLLGSGEKAFDDAVEKAIKTSPPFPVETKKKFRAQYALTK